MKQQLDLGSANALRGRDDYDVYGVDIVKSPDPRIILCDMVLEPLPFNSDSFDLVTAHDILEHIPGVLYLYNPDTKRNERRQPIIELFNEIYRVLKPNGELEIYVPKDDFSDTTHISRWGEETLNHLSGDYYGFHDHYNHTSRFEKLSSYIDEMNRVCAVFRAIKGLPDDAEYKINY